MIESSSLGNNCNKVVAIHSPSTSDPFLGANPAMDLTSHKLKIYWLPDSLHIYSCISGICNILVISRFSIVPKTGLLLFSFLFSHDPLSGVSFALIHHLESSCQYKVNESWEGLEVRILSVSLLDLYFGSQFLFLFRVGTSGQRIFRLDRNLPLINIK